MEIQDIEQGVIQLLNGEVTKEQLAKKLHIGLRYLSYKICDLQRYNPELYNEYIKKYPYKPREITNIDYEAVVIEMLKERMNMRDIIKRYGDAGLSERTLRRRIKEMEQTNPDLYWLYKKNALLNRRQIKLTEQKAFEFSSAIYELERRPVVLGKQTDNRRNELEELERQFLSLKSEGLSNSKAAEQMGTTFQILYKQFKDLEKIRKEEDFLESLKVKVQVQSKPTAKKENSNEEPKRKQEGR